MTNMQKIGLAMHVVTDSVKNNKLLLLGGAIIGEGIGVFYLGAPEIDFKQIYKCFTAAAAYSPYLGAAIGGAVILGIGKILLRTLFEEMEKKSKGSETIRD